jgi:cholesterol oxidase
MALSEHVDTVVVGSGFGGSVSAYRLAEAGRRVVVLERGRPYPPGTFPRTPQEMGKAFWDPSQGRFGLFDVWRFSGFDSVVSSGLGGGSLIYANVLLRKDERWFVSEEPMPGGGYERWPISRADLDPHYDAVEKMIGASPYPLHAAPFEATPKTHAMITAAEKNGIDWHLPPLAISFSPGAGRPPAPGLPIETPPYGNLHGMPRRTCELVGECDIGCNVGAKNTMDHTYLSAAAHHGADIRTRCDVREISPLPGGGYEVLYLRHDTDTPGPRSTKRQPRHRITCDRLVLGAGAYGTTFLLLNNRAALPGLSGALGSRFSGNGDLLTFLLPKRQRAGQHGGRTPSAATDFDASHGPVITTALRVGDTVDGHGHEGRGFYIEDAGYPGFVDWLVESTDVTGNAFRFAEFLARWAVNRVLGSARSSFSSQIAELVGDGRVAAGSMPLLGMGRDIPDGVMKLADGYLDIDWNTRTSMQYFSRVRDTMRKLADTLDADYVDNPIWFFKRVVTVHPVGGSPMGRNPSEGVCDEFGEVFNHPGLFVADGAVMPGPVGTNPSLTIAAHADRMATHILEQPSSRPSRTGKNRAPAVRPAEAATALSFTEEMKGYVGFGESDPNTGLKAGRAVGQRLMFHLTITADDVGTFLAQPHHQARAEGWIEADGLGGRLPVKQGTFNLFVDGGQARTRRMLYRLYFKDGAGKPLTLSGRKEIRDDSPLDIWRDTSTLYYLLLDGHVDEAEEPAATVRGAGVLKILKRDFARQLTTFRVHGPDGPEALADFGRFFVGQLWDVYGPQLVR